MTNLNETEGLNTTDEIKTAIMEIASSDRDAMMIWADPTDLEYRNVIARADELCGHSTDELYWGSHTVSIDTDVDPLEPSLRYNW